MPSSSNISNVIQAATDKLVDANNHHTTNTATDEHASLTKSSTAERSSNGLAANHSIASSTKLQQHSLVNDARTFRLHYPAHYTDYNVASIIQPYNVGKQRGERFFFMYSLLYWVPIMAYIVVSGSYHTFDAESYMKVGAAIALPAVIVPLAAPALCDDPHLPISQRYTTKANVFIWILSFIGNYLWTHYFYSVLHCSYTFPVSKWSLNEVPFALYLITHGYFHLYHVLSNVMLRVYWRTVGERSTISYALLGDDSADTKQRSASSNSRLRRAIIALVSVSVLVFVVSYVTAFGEAYTIARFEHYVIPDRHAMYLYGSVFYAIYFWCSFPVFYRLDEGRGECWSISRTVIEALSACMAVTMILDAWRLSIGNLDAITGGAKRSNITAVGERHGKYQALPWL